MIQIIMAILASGVSAASAVAITQNIGFVDVLGGFVVDGFLKTTIVLLGMQLFHKRMFLILACLMLVFGEITSVYIVGIVGVLGVILIEAIDFVRTRWLWSYTISLFESFCVKVIGYIQQCIPKRLHNNLFLVKVFVVIIAPLWPGVIVGALTMVPVLGAMVVFGYFMLGYTSIGLIIGALVSLL